MAEAKKTEAAAPAPTRKRIRLTTSMAGKNVQHKFGDILDLPADEADRHLANGNGVELSEEDEAAEAAAADARAKVRASRAAKAAK